MQILESVSVSFSQEAPLPSRLQTLEFTWFLSITTVRCSLQLCFHSSVAVKTGNYNKSKEQSFMLYKYVRMCICISSTCIFVYVCVYREQHTQLLCLLVHSWRTPSGQSQECYLGFPDKWQEQDFWSNPCCLRMSFLRELKSGATAKH